MTQLTFTPVQDPDHIAELANFAEEIFREYYPRMLTSEKLEYVLVRTLSAGVLVGQIADDGYEYYFADIDGDHVGYLGIQPREDCLYLGKVYIRAGERGKGFGRQAFEFVKRRMRELGLHAIRLACNRDNMDALTRYDHMGFSIYGEENVDIGNGYELNNYLLEWTDDKEKEPSAQ